VPQPIGEACVRRRDACEAHADFIRVLRYRPPPARFARHLPRCAGEDRKKKKEAERRQTQVKLSAPAGAGRATERSTRADPPLRARSPVGVPLTALRNGLSPVNARLQARLPGTWPERRSVTSSLRRQNRTQLMRALPAPICPSPVDAPHGALVVASRMMPKAARVRVITPPAGTALAPAFRSISRRRPP